MDNKDLIKKVSAEREISIVSDEGKVKKYVKIPNEKLSAYGKMAIAALYNGMKAKVPTTSPSDLYMCINPYGHGEIIAAKDFGKLGAIFDNGNLVGQARWVKADPAQMATTVNPPMYSAAICAMVVYEMLDAKLEQIIENQENILKYIETQDEAEIEAQRRILVEILNDRQYSMSKEQKSEKRVQISHIKEAASKQFIIYTKNIDFLLGKTKTEKNLAKLMQYHYYQFQALYNYKMATCLYEELSDYDNMNRLRDVISRIKEDYIDEYSSCNEKISDFAGNLFSRKLNSLGLAVGVLTFAQVCTIFLKQDYYVVTNSNEGFDYLKDSQIKKYNTMITNFKRNIEYLERENEELRLQTLKSLSYLETEKEVFLVGEDSIYLRSDEIIENP